MRVEIQNYNDNWQAVKDKTMTTIGKDTGKYPTSKWKTKLLRSEHSPIRDITISAKFYDIPYWVAMHFCRHKIGIEHFVSTQRTDRNIRGIPRDKLPQGALVDYAITLNAQAIINISRKRLCSGASKETRTAWEMFLSQLSVVEPELFELCVVECVYRGHCSEMFSCGYSESESLFNCDLQTYREYKGE